MDTITRMDFSVINDCVGMLESQEKILLNTIYWKPSKKDKNTLPNTAGVYAFWWIGDVNVLTEKLLNCHYELKAAHNRKKHITVEFCQEWIDKATVNGAIYLYVGKSTKIRNRVAGHIKPLTENIWKKSPVDAFSFHKRPNTTSQLRVGLERVFQKHCLDIIKENIAISWISFDGDSNAINRFYIENKFISHHLALFNIDVER